MVTAFLNNLVQGPDLFILLVIILIIFGPKKLPELARGIGQAVKEFHKAKDEFHEELTKSAPTPPVEQPKDTQGFKPATPPAQSEVASTPTAPEQKPLS